MLSEGTTASGPELLIELRREPGRPLRAQLEEGLREAVRSGRLMAGAPLPSSRALARDLGVSRRLVVEAFAQLSAEGYLATRQGSGTFVAETAAAAPAPIPAPEPRPPRYDFFPGAPDLSAFPRAAWARAVRDALRETPDHSLNYGDPRGAPALGVKDAGAGPAPGLARPACRARQGREGREAFLRHGHRCHLAARLRPP